jgi:hypothetical protein
MEELWKMPRDEDVKALILLVDSREFSNLLFSDSQGLIDEPIKWKRFNKLFHEAFSWIYWH